MVPARLDAHMAAPAVVEPRMRIGPPLPPAWGRTSSGAVGGGTSPGASEARRRSGDAVRRAGVVSPSFSVMTTPFAGRTVRYGRRAGPSARDGPVGAR